MIKNENSHADTMVAVQGHLELILLSKDIHSTLGSKRKYCFIPSGAVFCIHAQHWHRDAHLLSSAQFGVVLCQRSRSSRLQRLRPRRRIRAFARH